MMAARPRCGEAKKVAKGTGIMALTANARLPRNKKSGHQFLIAAKDRGFPQRGGVLAATYGRESAGLAVPRTMNSARSAGRIKPTHFPAAYPGEGQNRWLARCHYLPTLEAASGTARPTRHLAGWTVPDDLLLQELPRLLFQHPHCDLRRVLVVAVDAVRLLLEGRFVRRVNVAEGLRVAIDQREPRALHLDHDPVAGAE